LWPRGQSLGFRALSLVFRVQGSEFWIHDLGFILSNIYSGLRFRVYAEGFEGFCVRISGFSVAVLCARF
jgi:hypothetical protein